MDQEVAKTLGELELKLTELERELTSIGHRNPPSEPLQRPPGRLVDEAIESSDGRGDRPAPQTTTRPAEPTTTAPSGHISTYEGYPPPVKPPVPTQNLPHTQPSAPTQSPPAPHQYPPPARYPPSQHAPVEQPAPVEQHHPIDIAELVRFRDKLARTMDELIDEYSRLLSPKPGDTQHPPDA